MCRICRFSIAMPPRVAYAPVIEKQCGSVSHHQSRTVIDKVSPAPPRNFLGKNIESARPIDIRGKDDSAGRQMIKCKSKFGKLVFKRMFAVVDEEVDFVETAQKRRENVGRFSELKGPPISQVAWHEPAAGQILWHNRTAFSRPKLISIFAGEFRKIDRIQMA